MSIANAANQAVAAGQSATAASIAAADPNVVAAPAAPTTSDPVYNAFAGMASSLGIDPNTEVSVNYQQQGVGTVIQPINPDTAAPYQMSDLSFDPAEVGSTDPLSFLFHGSGNPSWYIGGAMNPIHLVDLQDINSQQGFYPGLQWHTDAYNPTWGANTLLQHFGSEVLPGGTYRALTVSKTSCSVNGGCYP